MLTHYTAESQGPRKTMQDAFAAIHDGTAGIFGVFDGHGNLGHQVAADLSASLEELSLAALAEDDHPQAIREVTEALAGVQQDWAPRREKGPENSGGSTALIALVGRSAISSVWLGDGIMRFYPDTVGPTTLITPHDVNHPGERARVEAMSYDVGDKYFPRRLAISRAIGHGIDRPFVSAEPDSKLEICERPGLLVLGTDGVYRNGSAPADFDSKVSSAEDYQTLADELAENGAHANRDNAAVIVVRCD